MLRPAAFALAVAIVVVSVPTAAHQCAERSIREKLDSAAAVFEGRVLTDVEQYDWETQLLNDQRVPSGKVAVLRAWKGVHTPVVRVRTVMSGLGDSYPLAKGERVIVFAPRGRDGILVVAACSGTYLIGGDVDHDYLDELLTELGPPSYFPPGVDAPPASRGGGCAGCIVAHHDEPIRPRWPLFMSALALAAFARSRRWRAR